MIMKVLKNGRQVYGKQIRNKLKIMLKTINDMKKKIDIYFQKVLAHSGDYYNEVADGLAKKAVGIKK
ncbi:RNase H family protein [Faecalibacillus intestinalis]|uniref:RNase H family protein n=1 Tax=Faecalibacillus intestinalis TaxID=1982626 RepID=UPI00351FB301